MTLLLFVTGSSSSSLLVAPVKSVKSIAAEGIAADDVWLDVAPVFLPPPPPVIPALRLVLTLVRAGALASRAVHEVNEVIEK
jgi:hypothetical protein